MDRLPQHIRRYQHNAFFCYTETALTVFFVIDADHHAIRYHAAAIDNGAQDTCVTTDTDLRQYHTLLYEGIGVNLDIGVE